MPGPMLNPTVGVKLLQDGAESPGRSTRTGDLSTSATHGTWLEALRTGNIWTISTPLAGITVTANMLTSVASSNCIVGLYNKGGGYAHILRAEIVCGSNATATGFVWGYITPTGISPAPTGVAKAKNHKTLTLGSSPMTVAFDGSVAVSGSGVTDLFRPIVAGLINTPITVEEADDDLIVPPNGFIGIFGDTVTTNAIVKAALTWEDVPL